MCSVRGKHIRWVLRHLALLSLSSHGLYVYQPNMSRQWLLGAAEVIFCCRQARENHLQLTR